MLNDEKKAFWKFFSIYFGSVASLILVAGFFYYMEQEKALIKKEHFSMIEYTRQLKMKQNPISSHITHQIKEIEIKNFNMSNFTIKENEFLKYMPHSWEGGYILITKDKTDYLEKLLSVKLYIIFVQVILLLLFAILSYFLAMRALRPMQRAITKLDKFSKDLIHDLNTPIAAMFLNIKLLESKKDFTNNKPLLRIKHSLEDIGQLHNNLTVLLQEDTMLVQKENLFDIINEVVNTHRKIFPHLQFIVKQTEVYAVVNRGAFKQIIVNIISNACKYNIENGYVQIYMKNDLLCIEDNGIGIENPEYIFERSYKEHVSGNGIGLDIVKRLCEVMEIDISADSQVGEGTIISLNFKD
ncbi:HAMP domain-containing sensor histidine kinase [Sulfurimonas sp.]|uniref:sensor histidine kinase n=1 Tax=Sulfurimonas sp. TaxID=2022749 RepID=UPI0025DD88A0|nr:HAMP domain-containing sensor histidine kinase [Sulfurimonas sp.]MBT5934590.1 HAMP domain-containing histidine kinase [Sulfurimonas sp.]